MSFYYNQVQTKVRIYTQNIQKKQTKNSSMYNLDLKKLAWRNRELRKRIIYRQQIMIGWIKFKQLQFSQSGFTIFCCLATYDCYDCLFCQTKTDLVQSDHLNEVIIKYLCNNLPPSFNNINWSFHLWHFLSSLSSYA